MCRFGLWELLRGFNGGSPRILVPGGGWGGPDKIRAPSETTPGVTSDGSGFLGQGPQDRGR